MQQDPSPLFAHKQDTPEKYNQCHQLSQSSAYKHQKQRNTNHDNGQRLTKTWLIKTNKQEKHTHHLEHQTSIGRTEKINKMKLSFQHRTTTQKKNLYIYSMKIKSLDKR